MKKVKSSISKASSYEEIGDFWNSHDLTTIDNKTKKIDFNVNIKSEKNYCAMDKEISYQLELLANKRGVSPDVLVNLFLQEKLKSLKLKKVS